VRAKTEIPRFSNHQIFFSSESKTTNLSTKKKWGTGKGFPAPQKTAARETPAAQNPTPGFPNGGWKTFRRACRSKRETCMSGVSALEAEEGVFGGAGGKKVPFGPLPDRVHFIRRRTKGGKRECENVHGEGRCNRRTVGRLEGGYNECIHFPPGNLSSFGRKWERGSEKRGA